MTQDEKLNKALETNDIEMLTELKGEGYDLSNINLVDLIENGTDIELLKFLIDSGTDISSKNEKGLSILISAIKKGEVDIVKLLIEKGVDIDSKDESLGFTPLMDAVGHENSKIVEFLITNGADVNCKNIFDETPLMTAIVMENFGLTRLLIKHGADVNCKARDDETPLMLAIEMENIGIIKLLINHGADINAKNKGNESILQIAYEKLNIEVIKILIKSNVDLNVPFNNDDGCALYVSISLDSYTKKATELNIDDPLIIEKQKAISNIKFIEKLIKNGADANSYFKDETSLIVAIQGGQADIVKLLVENGANINTHLKDGRTALMFASAKNNVGIAKLLIEEGADVNKKMEKNYTALMVASGIGSTDVAKILIKHNADINVQMDSGLTALSFAVSNNHIDIVKLLLNSNVDILKKNGNEEVLMLAAKRASKDIVKLLVKKGLNVNAQNEEGSTALMYAARNNHVDTVKYLLKKGADINVNNKKEFTVLSLALVDGNVDIVNYLIHEGANINTTDEMGGNLILQMLSEYVFINEEFLERIVGIHKDISSYKKNILDIVEILLKAGLDINAQTSDGTSALIIASMVRDNKLVKYLIKKGADVNMKNNSGLSALNMSLLDPKMMEYHFQNNAYYNQILRDSNLGKDFFTKSKIIKSNSLKTVQILLNSGAKFNIFLLQQLILFSDIKIAKLIIKQGSPPKSIQKYILKYLVCFSSYDLEERLNFLSDPAYKEALLSIFHSVHIPEKEYEKVLQLFFDNGFSINIKDKQGHTLLFYAVIHNNINMVRFLIERGINTNVENKHGYRAVDYISNNKDMQKLFLMHQIMPKKRTGKEDKIIMKEIQKERDRFLGRNENIDETLPFQLRNNISTVLENRDIEGLKDLIHKRIDLTNINMIDLIKYSYKAEFIGLLAKNGADLNVKDLDGKTALMYACELGRKKIVEILIKHGVDAEIKDNMGNDAIEYAITSEDQELINLILNYDELSALKHNPKELVKLLTNFTLDTPIKHTTHEWRKRIDEKYKNNFDLFLKHVNKQLDDIMDKLEFLSPNLSRKIYDFILSTEESQESWCSQGDITIGWSSLPGLREWVNNGNEPGDFKLKEQIIIGGEAISTFSEVIILFKSEIETIDDTLQNVFLEQKKKLGREFKINISNNLKGEKIYTDVEVFKDAIDEIFKEIQKYAKSNNAYQVEIELRKPSSEYVELHIIHVGSTSSRNGNELLKRIDSKGDIVELKKLLLNLCDWSIEASNKDGDFKIDCLTNDAVPTQPKNKPNGFTHILKFYK